MEKVVCEVVDTEDVVVVHDDTEDVVVDDDGQDWRLRC